MKGKAWQGSFKRCHWVLRSNAAGHPQRRSEDAFNSFSEVPRQNLWVSCGQGGHGSPDSSGIRPSKRLGFFQHRTPGTEKRHHTSPRISIMPLLCSRFSQAIGSRRVASRFVSTLRMGPISPIDSADEPFQRREGTNGKRPRLPARSRQVVREQGLQMGKGAGYRPK